MTREKAIAELDTFKKMAKSEIGEEALDMAIKALEQQPCDKAISSQEGLEKFNELVKAFTIGMALGFAKKYDEMDAIMKAIKALAPQPKIGQWIAQEIHNCYTDFKCSECGYIYSFMHLYGEPTADYTYCPNCGAKMEGDSKK